MATYLTSLQPDAVTVEEPAPKTVAAAKAKAHLLELLTEVDHDQAEVVITRRGKPVAKLVPYREVNQPDIAGCMKGTFEITGDVIGPEPDVWEAMQ